MSEKRWVLLIASEVGRTDSVSDRAMERLVEAISDEGYEVVRTTSPEDGLSLVTSDPSYSAILLDWDLEANSQFEERAALDIIRGVRHRNKRVPIFLIADRTLVSELPLEVIKQVYEYIHLFGDTPAFIASRLDTADRALPRAAFAAVFSRIAQIQRPVRLLLGRPRPHGRRGVSQASGGPGVPPLLRRKPAALGSGHLVGAARLLARSHRPSRAIPSATRPASSAPIGRSTSWAAPAPPTRSSATGSSPRTTSFWPTPTATNPFATR